MTETKDLTEEQVNEKLKDPNLTPEQKKKIQDEWNSVYRPGSK